MIRSLSIFITAALLFTGCGNQADRSKHDGLRVVSMAPNVTEILYTLGLSNETVGVSSYSSYPPAAAEKPIVGGTYDPNWEMILSLQPDLVVGLETQKEIAARLRALGVDFLGVPHERVDEIMQSILMIGEACGAEDAAKEVFQGLEKQLQKVPRFGKTEKPKILVCVGHDEQLTRMYIAARGTFYDDLIRRAGGTNACEQTAIKYPEISPEGLHALQPDLIIDLVPNPGSRLSLHPTYFSELWKHKNVVVLTNDYSFIPGPRFGLLLQDFINAIQPNDSD